MALVFFPFHTSLVGFSTLDELMRSFSTPCMVQSFTITGAEGPWDRCDIYAGARTDVSLVNVKRFFEYNGWVTDRDWKFNCVVVVGINNLSGIIVDMPAHSFPWCIDFFGMSGMDPHEIPLPDGMVSTHRFHINCIPCGRKKVSCTKNRADPCRRCEDEVCLPNAPMEINALAKRYLKALLVDRSVLCPAFQYVIATMGRKVDFTASYLIRDIAILGRIVKDDCPDGRHLTAESYLIAKSRVHQRFYVVNGEARLIDSTTVKELGMNLAGQNTGKSALAHILPHFGIAEPTHAYSFLNSAFMKIGEIVAGDFVVWDKDCTVNMARIMALVQYDLATDTFFFAFGWI